MKKSIFLIFAAILCSVSAWAAGYNNESHVYLKVDGTTKYYKVSEESWKTECSLPGTWGGVLKDQTFNNVLNLQIVGGAVGGWTDPNEKLSATLSYAVTQSTSTPTSWTNFGSITTSSKYNGGKNCFYYKNNGSTNVTPTTPGTYYLHIKITFGSTNKTSYVKFVVPPFTVAGSSAILGSDWDINDTNNDMTWSSGTTYTLTKSNVTLTKGETYECKVVVNHSWDNKAYPDNNYSISVDATGHYDITFSFDASKKQVTVSKTRLYAVIYNDNGKTSGSVPVTSYHASGSSVTAANNSGNLTKENYNFVGWNTKANGDGTDYIAGSGTFTMPTADMNLYAKWTEITHTVTFANDGNGTTNQTGAIEVGVITGIAIDATPNTDYEFNVWKSSHGGTFATTAADASNTFYPTANTTLTATFRSTAVNALLVVAGENITSVTGSAEPVTLGSSYPISATFPTGYKFHQWTADPAANATFGSATTAETTVTVNNGSVTVTASATEIMSTLTTSYTYDEGTPSFDAPTPPVSEIGISTTATITAATDIDYTLASWTLENCVRTDGGAENATTITVKSKGDGAAATVTANYNLIPKITLYFVNSTQWEVVACHHWKEDVSGTTWPGDLMEKVGAVYGFDIYKVKFAELEHDQCIFNNNNNEKQTGNLAVQDGKYYYPETDEWYATVAEIPTPCTDCSDYAITGSMNDWSARRNRLKVTANNDIVELTLELTAGDYEFKVAGPKGWFGNSGKYERKDSGNAWTYRIKDDENNDEDNARIYVDMTGEYTFTWKISTKELTITYPELPDFSQQTDIILFRPSTNWKKDGAHFAAYFFGATAEKWVDMTDADGDGIYEAANPKTNLSVKICCLKPGQTETKWDNVKWRSINYEIPTGVENCWVVNDEAEDDATGIWTVLIGESDNSTTLSAANSQTVNTLVNRQLKSEKLYTISLPFALDAEQVETIFGAGTTIYEFAQLAKEGEELVLYFSTPSAIAAATPYLIQPTQDVIKGFIVADATISSTPNNISFTVDYTTITMEAILSVEANAKTDGKYWLAADKYLYNNENDLPALRALFNVSTKSGMPPRARIALGENAATGLDNITNGENTTIKLIENGQLIIIRNGEKFNAQGVRL